MTIRVVLADDQALVRKGFRLLLESEPDIEVVGEAEDGAGAVEVVRWRRPDVVLMDIQMPGVDGLEACRQILGDQRNTTRVLILTTFERDEYVFDALRSGASGFLLKTAPPEDLIRGVHVVAQGEALLSPSVTRKVVRAFTTPQRRAAPSAELQRLTEREMEVLRLVADGNSNAEIAGELFITEATVKTHVSAMLSKLGLRDRVQAVIFAYEQGIAGAV